ncbi:fructokinase-like 2, chloroplastic isoform X1 [Arachis stenosperma]|uniref:fructokinase-like 2, chloroplastic isoform X1 n=1 Tax=Arachis stenosperma TaxID=217475 RepID=UPI0025ACB9F9|nr:fructokinase-like 2, chloroplastic isoform X1 [Arachis stenosperma]
MPTACGHSLFSDFPLSCSSLFVADRCVLSLVRLRSSPPPSLSLTPCSISSTPPVHNFRSRRKNAFRNVSDRVWKHGIDIQGKDDVDNMSGCKWSHVAMARRKASLDSDIGKSNENDAVVEKKTSRSSKTKRVTARTKKKSTDGSPEENIDASANEGLTSSSDDSKKRTRRTRKKVTSVSADLEEDTEVKEEKKVRRRRKPKEEKVIIEDKASEGETSDKEETSFIENVDDESDDDLEWVNYDEEDISYTYGWPPLVCCFGAAQYSFVPSGRPANRLINHDIHETMKDALWSPEKFVRAPGTSAGTVAIALASLGGKVAFMGKLGDDDYGQAMLYYMNVNKVQTRSVRVDSRRSTAASSMKIGKRSKLKMSCVKPCAEDCLTKTEINVDVLKEAKMFYFSTHSLLDRNMRSTTLQAIKIAKKFGAVVFYDLNLPMPLWQSREETKTFIQKVWNLADIIEVTKQELEFLCGITPTEEFDTKNNDWSKFVHYEREVVAPLWHEKLKILFVTNGTSKIHYYTQEFDGAILGMEDPPITPFTCDMSASGDGIVAALMRMLTVQPDFITDKEYLERSIKYAIDCGVVDQWIQGRVRGFPPREDMDDVIPDDNGIRSITETEYRTIKSDRELEPEDALEPVS